jgi:hypothetical protein
MVSSNNVLVHYEGKLIVRPVPINLAGENGNEMYLYQDGCQIIPRQGPRQISNIYLLPDPLHFSLVTTFK